MKTYKIGNKAKCLIRAYAPGQIGNTLITYGGEPYTIIDDCECEITFQQKNEDAKAEALHLRDARSFIKEIRVNNCLITNKILNLIFFKSEDKLLTSWEKTVSNDEKLIFLNTNESEIYQVFIYKNGELENAYGVIDDHLENGIAVEEDNTTYQVVYQYLDTINNTSSYSLNALNNFYLSLDLQLIGNEDDKTSDMFIHIDKCALNVDKNLNFGGKLNTVNLIFNIINEKDDTNYIVL